jgi:hypothetical protein
MADLVFPERPALPWARPAAVELVVRREPLAAIRQMLAISIHDVVNEPRCKCRVAEFYRVMRRIENENWLRRQLRAREEQAWIEAHL